MPVLGLLLALALSICFVQPDLSSEYVRQQTSSLPQESLQELELRQTALSQLPTAKMSAVGENESAETESVGGETRSVSCDCCEPRTSAMIAELTKSASEDRWSEGR